MVTPTSRRSFWIQKLSQQVAQALAERISNGVLGPGDPIGEREAIAAEFATSLGIVDHALDELVDRGLAARTAAGQFLVVEQSAPKEGIVLSPADTLADMISILELRSGIETLSAALAAERRNRMELSAIKSAADAYEAAASGTGDLAKADFGFHRTIADASGNSYIAELIDYLGPLIIPRLRLRFSFDVSARVPKLEQSIEEHWRIVAAISAGDAEKARAEMRAHLERAIALVREFATDEAAHPTNGDKTP